jgi:soluble P-type ATPase
MRPVQIGESSNDMLTIRPADSVCWLQSFRVCSRLIWAAPLLVGI